ncbi:MAG TPA: hypothetical protein DCL76_07500 [Chloroflexi bacterium]|nr:hypothetical protein [Chloroflexota bacterium]|tara:strand:- start:74 stop:727 length:654 start_codon:yes stop_codon:yes gene_type:complete
MSEKVDYSFTANDIPDIIKTKEEIEKLMPEDRPTPTEQLHDDIRKASAAVPGTEVTVQVPGLIPENLSAIPGYIAPEDDPNYVGVLGDVNPVTQPPTEYQGQIAQNAPNRSDYDPTGQAGINVTEPTLGDAPHNPLDDMPIANGTGTAGEYAEAVDHQVDSMKPHTDENAHECCQGNDPHTEMIGLLQDIAGTLHRVNDKLNMLIEKEFGTPNNDGT